MFFTSTPNTLRRLPYKRIIALTLAAFIAWVLVLTYTKPQQVAPLLISINRTVAGLQAVRMVLPPHELHYLRGGQGEAVVLLHGIFAEKDHWVDFARPLTAHYQVFIPDLPGFGESSRLEGQRYDYATQVLRLKTWLDALGLKRVHLGGSSMGGTLAALFAMQYPDQVASVAFIGAPHGIRSPVRSEMDALIDSGKSPLIVHNAHEFSEMMDFVFTQPPYLPYPIWHMTQAQAIHNADSNLRLWRAQLTDRYLLDSRIAQLTQPSLLLWGESDRLFHVSGVTAWQQKLPASRVKVLKEIGHLPMMEAPKQSAQVYREFLMSLANTHGRT